MPTLRPTTNKAVPISTMPGGTPQGDWLVPAIGWDAAAGIYRPYKITINQLNAALVNKVLSGTGAPGPGVGVDGDFYIDISSNPYTFYGPKAAGVWPAGSAAANTIRNGAGVPSNALGANGDFYIRTDVVPYWVYGPKAANVWPGGIPTANTVRYGTGVPAGGLGNNGDFYIRLDTSPYFVYGPKAGGAWAAGVPLTNTVRTGIIAPVVGDGNDGDWWIDSVASMIYTKSAGAWSAGTSLIGPVGPAAWAAPVAWVTATNYTATAPKSTVVQGGETYVCLITHTSGVFATDLGAGRWIKVAAKGADGAGTGDMLKSDNLSGLTNYTTARANLSLTPGTNVQAWDADLDTLAAFGNWKVMYTNGSGNPIALSLGADKTIFASNGATSAPGMRTIANLGIADLTTVNTFTKTQTGTAQAQTSGAGADLTLGNILTVAISSGSTFTVTNPATPPATQSYVNMQITMTAAGTLAFGNLFKGLSQYTQSVWTSDTMKDHLSFWWDGTNYCLVGVAKAVSA